MLIWSLAPKSKFYSWKKKKRNCEKYSNFLKFWVIFFSFQSFSQAFPVKFYDLVQLKKKKIVPTPLFWFPQIIHLMNQKLVLSNIWRQVGFYFLWSYSLSVNLTLRYLGESLIILHYIITVSFFFCLNYCVLWFHLNRFEQYISKLKYNVKNQENGYLLSYALKGSVEIWEIYHNLDFTWNQIWQFWGFKNCYFNNLRPWILVFVKIAHLKVFVDNSQKF